MMPNSSQLDTRTRRLCCQHLVVEIESAEACRVRLDGVSWWDTRPMLDPREQPPEFLDLNTEVLDLALALGVIARHQDPALAYLVRVLPESEWC